MKTVSAICLLLLFILAGFYVVNKYPIISDYQQTFIPGFNQDNNIQIAIRSFDKNFTPYFLVVNPYNFETKIIAVDQFKTRQTNTASPGYYTMQELQSTPYMKALTQYSAPPYILENYGVTRATRSIDGKFLTVDMCPSTKPFEKRLFNKLVMMSKKTKQAIPVAISISGLWMLKHEKEFNWLLAQQQNNKLKIIWINHSFSHVFYRDVPFDNNFLIVPRTNLEFEIIESEKSLLEKGQLPSVFFRLPGLVSNEKIISKLSDFGLIPIGSDAWLFHNEQPINGSIILVHGNGNEPEGIDLLMPLLDEKDLHLYPITDIFLPM